MIRFDFRSASRALLVRQQCSLSFRTLQRSVPCWQSDVCSYSTTMTTNNNFSQRRLFSTTNEATSKTAQSVASSSEEQTADETKPTSMVVYESPLGNVVGKLRSVSLLTAIVGAVGVPTMIALKGGIAAPTGILAVALTFVTGTMGSTAAIHFIFGPYIYQLERIPVRVCSSPSTTPAQQEKVPEQGSSSTGVSCPAADDTTTKPTMLKATTKTLFLQRREIVFDPITDVTPYKGLRPMCNFEAKGTPLYVHPGKAWHVRATSKL